jgi:hypothetical protein
MLTGSANHWSRLCPTTGSIGWCGGADPVIAVLRRLAFVAALVSVTPARGDPEHCREATASYNQAVVAVHAAVREYSQCATASLARDDCGAEFIELQVTHRDFENAVAERAAKCDGG